jgi:trehalose/maltose hydrolase-like predicted phosphorylase
MHGLVAARTGDTATALRFFRQTAAIDLSDSIDGSAGGIHIAALGGLWMMSVFGCAGLSLRSDGISIDPQLPIAWQNMAFRVQWRGRRVEIRIDQAERLITATLEAGAPMIVFVGGKPNHLVSLGSSSPIPW